MALKEENEKQLYLCELCTNTVTNNYRIICPFCSVEICEGCFQYSVTMELKNPICIYCKKNISLEFVLENNDTKWCKKTFIPFFENICLEKEKSYLIDTMPKYKKILRIREVKKQIRMLPSTKKIESNLLKDFSKFFKHNEDALKELCNTQIKRAKITEIKKDKEFIKLLDDKLNDKNNQKEILDIELFILEGKDSKNNKKEDKTIYICSCPNQMCRGFITNKYNCEICKLKICKLCMIEKKNKNHSCKRDDIESAQLIKESSKPCPKCYVPIFKISGCNQMFCTNCHVVFDWITLKIDKGNVHNAHYFDWMTNQNNNANINLVDVACGDIIEIYRKLSHNFTYGTSYNSSAYYNFQIIRKIFEVNRIFNGEIIDNIRENLIKNRFEDYRIEYLDNTISEKKWKSRIARDTINNERYRSLIELFEMYVTVTSDFIRQLAFKKITVTKLKNNYSQFYIYFEKSIDETLQIFGGNLNKRHQIVVNQAKID